LQDADRQEDAGETRPGRPGRSGDALPAAGAITATNTEHIGLFRFVSGIRLRHIARVDY
jgi:hypothetical protein